ncbi:MULTISPECIES: PTS sugar transporter [unclassified Jeotgalibaca]|uniref:PTS sugar transporter subunit IIA domain-containing protein n=1 Tax=unclassified Jeotgalibaca TaxID=2621505 RepID=UPI003FD59F11
MKKIIVTGHGNYATGIKSAMEMLSGPNADFFYLDFLDGDSEETLSAGMKEILEANSGEDSLIFCDLAGGTPFKVAATLARENEQIEVVAGANLGSLLEILFSKDNFELKELAGNIVASSRRSTMRFEKNPPPVDGEEGEGI